MTAISDYEAKIKGIVDDEQPVVVENMGDDLNVSMTHYVEAVRGIITAAGYNDRTLRWYKTKNGNPYISYRNCSMFYIRFDDDEKTVQDIQFLNLYKEQDYRWFRRKIVDTHPISSVNDISIYSYKITAAAADIDEAWKVQSQRIRKNNVAESHTDTDA